MNTGMRRQEPANSLQLMPTASSLPHASHPGDSHHTWVLGGGAGTHLESRDADTVHQVRFVGLQQGDEGEELVPAAHPVPVI